MTDRPFLIADRYRYSCRFTFTMVFFSGEERRHLKRVSDATNTLHVMNEPFSEDARTFGTWLKSLQYANGLFGVKLKLEQETVNPTYVV